MKNLLYLLPVLLLATAACRKDKKEMEIPLTIRQFLPNSGNAGTVVTIQGTGFSRNEDENTVTFNGAVAKVISSNDTALVVLSPEGGSTGPLAVKVGERKAEYGTYTYQLLSVHGISPQNGPAGTNIAIRGTGFTSVETPAAVTVNGQAAIVVSVNDTLLVAAVPEAAGSGALKVSVGAMEADGPVFTYQAISSIKPLTGGAGTRVTIQGEGFETSAAGNIVAFNGKPATVISAEGTKLVVEAPASVESGPLTVTIHGQKTTGPVFTLVPPPLIQRVAPLSGPAGTEVTITGNNFSAEPAENIVSFNGINAIIKTATEQQMVVVLPAGAGKGIMNVTVNDQLTAGPEFVEQALGISRLTPDNGYNPGAEITLKGTGFSTNPAENIVTFNGVPAQVTAATDTTVIAILPAGFSTGPVNITVRGVQAKGPEFRRSGVITLVGGPGTGVISSFPGGMAIDSRGNIFFADQNRINKVTSNGSMTVFAGSAEGASGNQDGTGTAAMFSFPQGLAIDANDNLYVAEAGNSAIRKVTPTGVVTTVASGLPSQPAAIVVNPAGNVYVSLINQGTYKMSANGNLVKLINDFPVYSIFVDAQENIYTGYNSTFVKIAQSGASSILAGSYTQGFLDGKGDQAMFFQVNGVARDHTTGNFYVTDDYNAAIRMVTPAGEVTTITGAAGTHDSFVLGYQDGALKEALFMLGLSNIAVDREGNIYVMDPGNTALRKIILR